MSAVDLNTLLVAAAIVVLVGVTAVRLSTRAGLPSLLLYLAIGVALGESGLGLRFDDAALTQVLGTLALAVILAEGGLTTSLSIVRPVMGLSPSWRRSAWASASPSPRGRATCLLDFDARTALLLGAVVSSTDAAAVFAVLRSLPLRAATRATLEAESGFNDPPVIILVRSSSPTRGSTWSAGDAPSGFASADGRRCGRRHRRSRFLGGLVAKPGRAPDRRPLPAGHPRFRLRSASVPPARSAAVPSWPSTSPA